MLVVANCIRQQKQRAGQAQPPEHNRNNDLPLFLGGIPLDNKTRKENRIAQPADQGPKIDPIQLSIFPKEIVHGTHIKWRLRQKHPVRNAKRTAAKSAAGNDFHNLQFIAGI